MDNCSVAELARGRTIIVDAPATEASVARWFGPAFALASRPSGTEDLIGQRVRLTAIAQWSTGPSRESTATVLSLYPLSDIRPARIAPALLTLPAGFRETPWPGERGLPTGTSTSSLRWLRFGGDR